MTSFLYSASRGRFSSWRSKFSPKIVKFIEGLNSSNGVLDKGEVARLGLGTDRFFCFGSWDGHRTLWQQAQLYCHARYLKPVQTDGGERVAYDSSDSLYDNKISPNKSKTVTNAKAGESYHNWGCAIDVYICNKNGSIDWSLNYNRLYESLGLVQWGKDCGLEWGGSWADNGHFQDSVMLPISEFWTESNAKRGYQFFGFGSSDSAVSARNFDKKKCLIVVAILAVVVGFVCVRKKFWG